MACFFSSVITCINSSLEDLALPSPGNFDIFSIQKLKKKRYWLRNLKTFVLFAKKLGDKNKDGSLGSLLIKIEDTVVSDFEHGFPSLKKEIDYWYMAMSDNSQQSNSLTADEVAEITESIWNNLVNLPFFLQVLAEAMEVLREHMKFLKNFCSFATMRGVDHGKMKDFLTHAEAVAISAAHLCFLCGDDIEGKEWRKGMRFKISILVQKIKPIDPHVCETYSQVISCSKFSRRLDAPSHIQEMVDDSTILMKNFVDSLISILWVMLQQDTCHVASLKDHRQVLYEGLRSLRTILKKLQPKDIDEKTMDDIGIMVCDAGILVCLFHHKIVEIDLDLQDLWERIDVFLAEAKEKVPQTSRFYPSSINEPGLVDFLLQNLMELTNGKVEPIVQSRVQSIEEGLLYLRALLGEIVELRHEQEELQALWNRVLEVTYRVEFLIDHLIVGDISDPFSKQFDSVIEDIQNIKTDSCKSSSAKRQDIKFKEVSTIASPVLPPQKMASLTTEIVGFHDEARSIMDRLQRGSKHLKVIAIVGMGGIGKTTLAAKVCDDPEVIRYFFAHARCAVSQTLDKKKLLLELLDQFHVEKCSELTEDDLAEKLWKHLRGKRYLIFLDDVWTIEAWNSLHASFPDDFTGSRIILTTRNHNAAPLSIIDQEPLHLRQLNERESLELLQGKSGKVWPLELYNLGMQIVENCKGLPLTIVIVAGLLATTDQDGWKEIVDGLSSGVVSITEQCMSSMELSYRHLPDYLKPCFLYFGAFPEDQEVLVWKLIRLWIAEGFVQKSKLKSVEDAAEDYMKDLIGRSLITVSKRGSMGGVKTCRIHDLLRDFCLKKAEDEHFLHLVKGYDELLAFNEPSNLRRLCIHSEPQHLKDSKLFCPRARSLLFFSEEFSYVKEIPIDIFLVQIFKFVRVLDFERIYLGSVFPSEIELLVQLRYLAIRGRIQVIPSWIGKLSMLETFIVDPFGKEVSLPDSIWDLQKLKYLYIRKNYASCSLPSGNPVDSSGLYELDTFCGVVFLCDPRSMEKQMSKFPNIRKLKCVMSKHCFGVPDFLRRLEFLSIKWRWPGVQFEFSFPANLKKLTLERSKLPWSQISTIEGLPNLEVLKLLSASFMGETWEMEEGGEFPKLRFLKLFELDLVRWTGWDDQFPCLEKLVLEKCRKLEEMPSCLESTITLEMIEVSQGTEATTNFVKHIKEQQVNMGNLALNVFLF